MSSIKHILDSLNEAEAIKKENAALKVALEEISKALGTILLEQPGKKSRKSADPKVMLQPEKEDPKKKATSRPHFNNCKHCNRRFRCGLGTSRHSDSMYCSQACNSRAHYDRGLKAKAALAAQRGAPSVN
jgi:predicted metal-dependent phosphoesterase TrpH